MQGGDFQFGRPHVPIRIGEGTAAEAAAHPWQGQKAHPQAIEQGRHGHGPSGEAGGRERQQASDGLALAPGQLHGRRAAHGGSDQANGCLGALLDLGQHRFQVGQHPPGAVVGAGGPGAEAKAEQIGDEKLVAWGQQGHQPPEFQKAAVKAVQEQQRRALADHGHGPAQGFRSVAVPWGADLGPGPHQARQVPPLHRRRQVASERIDQVAGGVAHQLLLGAARLLGTSGRGEGDQGVQL
jgi:hypothetical protein